MAEINPYKLSIPAAEADKGVIAGSRIYSTPGILYGDGRGGFRTAEPGTDYAFPLLKGNGPPLPTMVANLGQHYFDMLATSPPYEYICVGYSVSGFVWRVYGDAGEGFRVLGRFSTLDELRAAVTAGDVARPDPGDAYFIGTIPPYDVVVWDGVSQGWDNIGPLGGSSGGSSGSAVGLPPHGTEGQVLRKNSAADYDASWGDAVANGSLTASKFAPGAVNEAALATDAVGTEKIKPGAVTGDKLALNAAHDSVTLTLKATGWTDKKQTVSVAAVTALTDIVVSPAPGDYRAYGDAGVYCLSQSAGTLTFAAQDIPTVDMVVNILILR